MPTGILGRFLYSEIIFLTFSVSFCWLEESPELVGALPVVFPSAFIKYILNSSASFTSLGTISFLSLIEIWSSEWRFLLEKKGFTSYQNYFLAAISLEETDLKYCFFCHLRFLLRYLTFCSSKKLSPEGHLEYLFFVLDLFIIALFSCLVIKGALFPRNLFCVRGACLSDHISKNWWKHGKRFLVLNEPVLISWSNSWGNSYIPVYY